MLSCCTYEPVWGEGYCKRYALSQLQLLPSFHKGSEKRPLCPSLPPTYVYQGSYVQDMIKQRFEDKNTMKCSFGRILRRCWSKFVCPVDLWALWWEKKLNRFFKLFKYLLCSFHYFSPTTSFPKSMLCHFDTVSLDFLNHGMRDNHSNA